MLSENLQSVFQRASDQDEHTRFGSVAPTIETIFENFSVWCEDDLVSTPPSDNGEQMYLTHVYLLQKSQRAAKVFQQNQLRLGYQINAETMSLTAKSVLHDRIHEIAFPFRRGLEVSLHLQVKTRCKRARQ